MVEGFGFRVYGATGTLRLGTIQVFGSFFVGLFLRLRIWGLYRAIQG